MARPFRHTLRVRYSECDPQGVVFNANYVTYFDVVLTELWRAAGCDYRDVLASGTDSVVAEVNVRYLGGAGFDDELTLEASVTRLGNTSMSTRIAVRRDDDEVAEGLIRHVFVDAQTREKKPMPELVRDALEPYVEPVPA